MSNRFGHLSLSKLEFEVIVGKSIGEGRPTRCFGYVQCYDERPKCRIDELLKSQGLQRGHPVTFLSDGGETVRNLPVELYPDGEHILDWFHLTMRLTVMGQMVKRLAKSQNPVPISPIEKDFERLKWYLWHGNTYRAFQVLNGLESDLDCLEDPESKKLLKTVQELDTCIKRNQKIIPNYGDRSRYGERVSTGFAESTINQVVSKRFVKKQQMRWTRRGAHLLLQIRTKVLNNDLRETFCR